MQAGPWCNGNTTVFGAVFLGSSPSGPTKKPPVKGGFFYFSKTFLDFKCNDRPDGVIHKVFADAAIEEMGKTGTSVGAHSD